MILRGRPPRPRLDGPHRGLVVPGGVLFALALGVAAPAPRAAPGRTTASAGAPSTRLPGLLSSFLSGGGRREPEGRGGRGPAPGGRLRPAIVAVPLAVDRDAEIALLANLITLTPGTLSLDVSPDRRTLYVHAMATNALTYLRREIQEGFERRILEVFR